MVGADRKPPADTLEQGPTNKGLAPGWDVEGGVPKYDPEKRVGGQTDRSTKGDRYKPPDEEDSEGATEAPEAE